MTAIDPNLFQSPFRAGITIDAYQMEPLRKALRLPRVNLFIADDTGLGKTIEAGLIARELLLHKKVKTVVVAAPPSMLEQHERQPDQLALDFSAEEKRQLQANIAAWRRRLAQFDTEMERDPERVRAFYEVQATRVEPVGLVYLWPETN